MRNAYLFVLCIVLAIAVPGRMLHAQDTSDVSLTPTVKLELEVDALNALNDLNLTPDQLSALKDLASDTAGTLSETPAAVTPAYAAALRDLRLALLGKNADRIDAAEDRVSDLADKQEDDAEPDVTQSDSAKSKAPDLLKSLSVKQVANYISENSDDIDDPVQLLIDAVHQCRGMSEDDFADLRDDTAQELGIFAGGSNPQRTPSIVGRSKALLTKVHKMTNDDYASQQSALEDEARKLAGGTDPIPHLRHWMENEMADLLANPQLAAAIDDWLAAGKG